MSINIDIISCVSSGVIAVMRNVSDAGTVVGLISGRAGGLWVGTWNKWTGVI